MDELVLLRPNLKRLKLTGVLESLDIRIDQAVQEKWSYSHFLHHLLSDEIERRNYKQLQKILSKSNLEPEKTLELFDFSFNRKIPEKTMKELASCTYLERKQVIFFVGPSGVGKSHLAQALGHEACRRGIATLYRNTYNLFKWLNAGHGDGTHDRRMKQVITMPLLILDDFGLRDLSVEQQADLYEIISERYEKASTIITSNRDFNEWPTIFSNPLMGSAAMDRLVHKAVKIVIQGNSYRLTSFVNTHKNSQSEN